MTTRDRAGITHSGSTVLAFADAFEPGFKAGGPIRSMAATLDRLGPETRVLLVTRDRDLGDTAPYPGLSGALTQRRHHRVFYLNTRNIRHWQTALRMAREVRADVLYVNSLWSPLFTLVPIMAHAARLLGSRALAIAPRGGLSPGALSIKPRKKRLALKALRRVLPLLSPVFVASAKEERGDILREFPWADTVIAVDRLGPEPPSDVRPSRKEPSFVYVGRIAPMKNLTTCLEALALTRKKLQFTIVGPIEDREYWSRCEEIIGRMPRTVNLVYAGPVPSHAVREVFAEHDAFVFPTLGENFGHVILESLSVGCPAIVSARTPWTSTLEEGGGSVISSLDAQDWANELDRIAGMTADERTALKARALEAYARWRTGQQHGPGIEHALEFIGRRPR